jgi:hypothetical protein
MLVGSVAFVSVCGFDLTTTAQGQSIPFEARHHQGFLDNLNLDLWAQQGGFMSTAIRGLRTFVILGCSLLTVAFAAPATAQQPVQVQCGAGGTIASALARPAGALVIVVNGTCNENVTIARDDVTLKGAPGATISGPDSTKNTITVTGARITIESLSVTGGSNGIVGRGASLLSVLDCDVQNTAGSGIVFFQSAGGVVDGSTVQANPSEGILIESGSATLTNNTIQNNSQWGVVTANGASARIGISNSGQYDGNTIENNGFGGIHIILGAAAVVGGNTISGNGTNQQNIFRVGIRVFDAVADIAGGNTITNNASSGVLIHASRVRIGDRLFGSSVNTISQNGSQVTQAFPFANGGVFAYVDAAIDIMDAIITGNTGSGVALIFRSNATITAGQITRNTAGGVDLETGSAVIFELFQSSPASVTGNSVADLRWAGSDVRYTGFGSNALAGIGTISNCPPANF